MAAFFHLRVLASDRAFYDGDCESLTVPVSDGELGILAHHSNLVAAVVPGALRARLPDGRFSEAAISGGLLKGTDDISDALLPVGVKGGHDLRFPEEPHIGGGHIRRRLAMSSAWRTAGSGPRRSTPPGPAGRRPGPGRPSSSGGASRNTGAPRPIWPVPSTA